MTQREAVLEAKRRFGPHGYAVMRVVSKRRYRWYCVGNETGNKGQALYPERWEEAFADADRREVK